MAAPIKLGSAANSAALIEIPGSRPEKHSNGLDVVVRRYRCASLPESAPIPTLYSDDRGHGYLSMYLVDWSAALLEGVASEIELTYMGTLDGSLPATRSTTRWDVQQARFTSFTGKTSLDLTYIAPSSTVVTWATAAPDIGSISPPAPASVTGVEAVFKSTEGITAPTTLAAAIAYFFQETATVGETEEVVSGKFWRATVTKQNLLFSSQA